MEAEFVNKVHRFLKSAGKIKFLYAWQNENEANDITVLVDSDWAGNTETRKSTSGGVLKVCKHKNTVYARLGVLVFRCSDVQVFRCSRVQVF